MMATPLATATRTTVRRGVAAAAAKRGPVATSSSCHHQRKWLSTQEHSTNNEKPASSSKQRFVVDRFVAGEWDDEHKDPLYRPRYKSRARIISADDYANRNQVTFEEQYQTYGEAMISLSWMDRHTQKRIYQLYLEWMKKAHEQYGKTSHEYVCRMLAQRFNITPFRAGAIVQLQHNEEQYKLNHPDLELLEEEAEFMDEAIAEVIRIAYWATGEIAPQEFVEDPARTGGKGDHKKFNSIDDIFDMQTLVESAHMRDKAKAEVLINDHVYIEDVDDDSIDVTINSDVKSLMQRQQRLAEQQQQYFSTKAAAAVATPVAADSSSSEAMLPFHKPQYTDEKPKRPRWKYVAQIVNTRDAKKGKEHEGKRGRKHRAGFVQHCTDNTLVEHDGELRVANMAEAKNVAWKPTRHIHEFVYADAKKGWLDRAIRGQTNAWGKAPVFAANMKASAPAASQKEEGGKEEVVVELTTGDEVVEIEDGEVAGMKAEEDESSDSSSDDDSSSSSTSVEEGAGNEDEETDSGYEDDTTSGAADVPVEETKEEPDESSSAGPGEKTNEEPDETK